MHCVRSTLAQHLYPQLKLFMFVRTQGYDRSRATVTSTNCKFDACAVFVRDAVPYSRESRVHPITLRCSAAPERKILFSHPCLFTCTPPFYLAGVQHPCTCLKPSTLILCAHADEMDFADYFNKMSRLGAKFNSNQYCESAMPCYDVLCGCALPSNAMRALAWPKRSHTCLAAAP